MWRLPPKVIQYAPNFIAQQVVSDLHGDRTTGLLKKIIDSRPVDVKQVMLSGAEHLNVNETTPLTIAVGGVTLGGSGKTQVVRYLVERFLKHGCRSIYILGHGYRSRSNKACVEPSYVHHDKPNSFAQFGDEAVMLASHFHSDIKKTKDNVGSSPSSDSSISLTSSVKVLAGSSWYNKWSFAKKEGAQVIISDGGLYTDNLPRHIGITVLSSDDHLALIPLGRLSRPPSKWAKGQNYLLWGIKNGTKPFASKLSLDVRSRLIHKGFLSLKTKDFYKNLPVKQNDSISVVCGIANPKRFKHRLLQMGYSIDRWYQVRDHVPMPLQIIQAINNSPKKLWVTTMKDAPKFNDPSPYLWALDVALSVDSNPED